MASATTSNSNGVSHVAKDLPNLHQVNQEIRPKSEDQAFWWGALGEPMAKLLQANSYSDEVQLKYLRWFYNHIPSALGPRPINGKPYYGSWITHDLSPFEWSLNWKEKSSKQTVRFTVEPMTLKAGTAEDPINQLGAKEFLEGVQKDLPSLELTRFNQFLEAMNVPNDDVDDAIAKHPPHFPRSRIWIAFDLEHSGNLLAKAYHLPHWRAIQSGKSANIIVSDAIRACNGEDGSTYDAGLDAIKSYLSTYSSDEEAPQMGLLSNDCTPDKPGMRLKAYFRSSVDSLAKVKEMYSLGGRLQGDNITASINGISELWYHLFGLDSSDPKSENKVCVGDDKCIFVYEMRSTKDSKPDIDVKFHIPMWALARTDEQISDLMAAWFESHGHAKLASRYKADLKNTFQDSFTERGTHTYLSITHTEKTGLYMTLYLSPKLPEFYY